MKFALLLALTAAPAFPDVAPRDLFGNPAFGSASGSVEVKIDARLELAGLAQLLARESAPSDFRAPDIAYIRDLRDRFSRHAGHPAARLHAEPAMKEWRFSSRAEVLVLLSDPPALDERHPYSQTLVEQAGGLKRLDAWLDALGSFAHQTSFFSAFPDSAKLLEPEAVRVRRLLKAEDFLGRIEAYAGYQFTGRYEVLLSPFFAAGAGLNTVTHADDGTYIHTTVGPRVDASGAAAFEPRDLPETLWHELGHALFDDLADMHGDEIERRRPLGFAERDCYGSWRQCVKEHVVRAVMLRLVSKHYGKAEGDSRLAAESAEKYPYLGAMLSELQSYESGRKNHPTLAHFYPRLLAALPKDPAAGTFSGEALTGWLDSCLMDFPSRKRAARTVRFLDSALSLAPDAGLSLRKAVLAYHLGRFEDAAAAADSALAARADHPGALAIRRLALLERARGDYRRLKELCGAAGCGELRRLVEPGFREADDLRAPLHRRGAR